MATELQPMLNDEETNQHKDAWDTGLCSRYYFDFAMDC